jgi:hypothetical protein
MMQVASDLGMAIEFDPNGRWFIDRLGRRVNLTRTRVTQRLVKALVARWQKSPGAPIPTREIFDIGWDSANIRHTSAQSRVYMAMSRLRALGLGKVLTYGRTGYFLEPGAVRVRADA